ncbi:hypothetical protein [Amycolatopsis taiwanensis]|nr:hypothetical protein [Amycolatopsis taiwanensis]
MIRRLLARLADWAIALLDRGDSMRWTDEYVLLLDEQNRRGEGR